MGGPQSLLTALKLSPFGRRCSIGRVKEFKCGKAGGAGMAWLYLLVAGVLEIGWPLGLKYARADDGSLRYGPIVAAAVSMILSGTFLYLAQRDIPMGTAYAVWTGIGTLGAFTLGIVLFAEPATAMRMVCATLILAGIVGLKLFS